jgi:serine/threonine protein kinase
MKLAPGTKLGPYEILEPISAGGMGEVWKARDTRLGRIVAIKKVKEQHGERFKQEARSIAALNHPNICQIHDIGDDYLVLEYVEGKPLSSPIPEKEAVRLAIQIATALEAAHRKGIIHRDLKPGNILVTDEGSVKLLDFGLAKLYEQSAGESTAEFPATQAGTVLGTVAYMSPEQAQGQPADARSDIFSFGLVLYEMLSGRRAFSGDTPLVIGSALMKEEPPPLKASPLLEKIVSRCLAKQPSARYQSISEVKKALEQILAEKAAQPATEPQPSIAVLPFVNMSGDKEQEYFSDGLAEEIINALTQIPDLKVTSRTSAFAFRGKQQDITKIAEALHVRTILEGSVRKFGSRIRISAQLINAADGYHLWSERYDREMSDLFAIQDEISSAIAEKLRGRLSGNRTLIKRHTENAEAYNLYLKGRYHFYKFTLQSLEKGKEYYEHALAVDPNYALAWGGLSQLYKVMGFLGLKPPKESNTQSSQAALRALELDERLPIAHAMMGAMRACTFDWKGAEREFRWAKGS